MEKLQTKKMLKNKMQKGKDVKDPKSIREILKSSDLTYKQQNEIARHMKGRDLSDKEFNEELKGRIKRQEDINKLIGELVKCVEVYGR